MNARQEDANLDPYVRLARQAIRAHVMDGLTIDPPRALPLEMERPAAAFVSIKKRGQLRGCMGTIEPTAPSAACEIVANAIKAATADPRFPPVQPKELAALEISVDVLAPPEQVESDDLDPAQFGVIVESGWRRGLLLPDLPGVTSTQEQVRIARRKAGIAADEPIVLWRFRVERHV